MKRSHETSSSLREAIGAANFSMVEEDKLDFINKNLRECPNECQGISTKAFGVYQRCYLLMICPKCDEDWFLCTSCGASQRKRISSQTQLINHSKNHRKKKKPETQTYLESNKEEDLVGGYGSDSSVPINNISQEVPTHNHMDIVWSNLTSSSDLGFQEECSSAYFQQCFLGASSTSGMNYLALRSSTHCDFVASDYASQQLPKGHAELQTRIAKLAYSLTRSKNNHLAKVLYGSYRVGCENGFMCALRMLEDDPRIDNKIIRDWIARGFSQDMITSDATRLSTRIPRNQKDIRSMYLEGKRAIVPNLPIPKIMDDVDGHSYTLVSDCIRHFLAHGSLSDMESISRKLLDTETNTVIHPSVSERAKAILQNTQEIDCVLPSYILFWSDDVEPNRTKANRGSVWLLTATIATHMENGHSMRNTYPIAVGSKGKDHGTIIRKIEQDMADLRTGSCPEFYVGKEKKKTRIAFETFCTLQDQPERRDFNYLRAGNGATTGRFGVSADHRQLYEKGVLVSCSFCSTKLKADLRAGRCDWPLSSCQFCLRWDALDNRNELALFKAPKHYPETSPRLVPGTRLICPFQITYNTLKEGLDLVHEGYVNGGWTQSNCSAFLEVEGMSTKFIKTVMDYCARAYSYELAKANPEEFGLILQAAQRQPAQYGKVPIPAAWTRPTVKLEQHPDVIMHLLFLGIVKTVVQRIQDTLKVQSKLTSFLKSCSTYLTPILRMDIDWMAIQPFQQGKMGGWVSENYLGFCRILPWFFQNIDSAETQISENQPPHNLPANKWLLRHNKHWLEIRGLDTRGSAQVLRERVAKCMQDGAPDPIEAPHIPAASIEALINSLLVLIQCAMCKSVSTALVNKTHYAVRVFLSEYDAICRPLKEEGKVPAVLSSYNFICLLNLPSVMKQYGPLRHLWEGGPRGEGFVRFAKPLMTQGLRKNWHRQLLRKMHRNIALDSIIPDDQNIDSGTNSYLQQYKGKFHLYPSAFNVRDSLFGKTPLSVVLVDDQAGVRIFSVVRSYKEALEIKLLPTLPVHKFGFHYYEFGIEDGDGESRIFENVSRIEFGMLLPLLKPGGDEKKFALISSNWKSLCPSVTLAELLV